MATKTLAAAPAPKVAPPPVSAYQQLWVHHRGVALAKNQVGWIWALKTDAATMIAAGDAVDPYTTPIPYISNKPAPPPVVTLALSNFGMEPTGSVVHVSLADNAKVTNGTKLTLQSTAGDPAARAAINGRVGTVADWQAGATAFSLGGIDLSVGLDVAGLTATGTVTP